jgi:hypothetical protein
MINRSPDDLGFARWLYLHDSNWKMSGNLNDAMHPMIAHESAAAKRLWAATD